MFNGVLLIRNEIAALMPLETRRLVSSAFSRNLTQMTSSAKISSLKSPVSIFLVRPNDSKQVQV